MAFQPTAEMIECARRVFAARVVLQVVEPIVRGYQTQILAEGQWRVQEKYRDRLGDRVILDPKSAFLMEAENLTTYFAACRSARQAAGLIVEDEDFCPLSVAEIDLMNAEFALIDAMAPVTGLTSQKLRVAKREYIDEAVNLTLQLLGQYVPPEAGANDFEFSRVKFRDTAKAAKRSASPGL